MGAASRAKGNRGQLEARKIWIENNFQTVPWQAGLDGPDFVAVRGDGLVLSVEVTRDGQRIPKSLYLNLEKAKKSRTGIPIGRLRRDYEDPLIVLYEKDFFKLIKKNGGPDVQAGPP